jgi:predicted MPP superfamily phosphohydrolase
MKWFILAFLSIYFLMNLYVYLKLRHRAILPVLTLGFFSPFLMRYADANFSPSLSYIIGLGTLFYMGFLLYLVVSFLLLDLYSLFVRVMHFIFGINPLPRPSKKLSIVIALSLALSLSAYSYYETLKPEVYHFHIKTDKVSQGIRIMHISDVHLGPVMGMDKIKLIKEVYEKYKPDLLVSTGDLVDGNMKRKDGLAQALREMSPPLGKFAVLGNHEYYRGVQQAIEFTESAGFVLLRGDWVDLGSIIVVGVDDDDCRFFNACVGPLSEYEILKDLPKDKFILVLKHKPRVDKRALGLFDLMLAGHTHGGVYYPVGKFIIPRLFDANAGWVELGKGSALFVSKGVGTGGPPMRFFEPPDMAIIDIQF